MYNCLVQHYEIVDVQLLHSKSITDIDTYTCQLTFHHTLSNLSVLSNNIGIEIQSINTALCHVTNDNLLKNMCSEIPHHLRLTQLQTDLYTCTEKNFRGSFLCPECPTYIILSYDLYIMYCLHV